MKKTLLSLSILCLVIFANAQTFVSTTAENKNTVLEEFTGIHCTYCPDGHKRAQELKDANPNDVVLINIHVGGYAVPNPGEPDFRTPYGAAIDGQAGVSGYPAGTINRKDFTAQGWDQNGGTAMSRGSWVNASAIMLAEPSYVNVEAQATLDISTRLLTVDVEAYYTSNGAATNYINVALIQNNIAGPQTGGSTYNPSQILPNGDYNHNHMLRHLLTGQWGNVINTTTTGSFYSNTLTYTVPADLNGVAYDLFNLEVVVFMSEGPGTEIISGNDGSMTLIVPPGTNLVDLEAATNMAMPASYCDGNITPEITVTNNSTINVDTFEVSYILDGNAAVTQVVNNLAPSASTTISFPAITLTNGSHEIFYNVNTDNAVTFIDNVSSNNNVSSGTINTISPNSFASSHTEGFENYGLSDNVINNTILINSSTENTYVVDNGVSGNVTWNLGAYGNSNKSWRMRFFTWGLGSKASLVFENIDLSNTTGNGLRFSYAYAQYSTENDKLEILVSTDCGATWNTVFNEAGTSLATAPAVSTGHFYPAVNQWDSVNIDMGAYDGNSAVMIAFKGTSDYGNNLYFDDIEISNNVDLSNPYILSTKELNAASFSVKAYPNPIINSGFLELKLNAKEKVNASIYNLLGKEVQPIASENFSSGVHRLEFNSRNLANGVYLIKVEINGELQTEKIVISN